MKKKISLITIMLFFVGIFCDLSNSSIIAQDAIDLPSLDPSNPGAGKTCYDTITQKAASQVRFCGTCDFVDNSTDAWNASTSSCSPD